MRMHRPDPDSDLIWIGATAEGSWLIRVEGKLTRAYLRPPNRGLMPRAEFYGPDHHAHAVFYIQAKLNQEWEGM